jgi:hypothetical protein
MTTYVKFLYTTFLGYNIRDYAWTWTDHYTKKPARFNTPEARKAYFGSYAKYLIEDPNV